MKISKQDALTWFRFFAELPEDEDLLPHQQEIAWAVFSQIEEAVDDRFRRRRSEGSRRSEGAPSSSEMSAAFPQGAAPASRARA